MLSPRVRAVLVPAVATPALAVVSYAVVRSFLPSPDQPAAAAGAELVAGSSPLPVAIALIMWGAVLVLLAAWWAERDA